MRYEARCGLPHTTTTIVLLMMSLLAACPRAALAQGQGPSAIHAGEVRMERVLRKRMITGDVRAARRANLATQEQGLLVELNVREG
ncbi:MAG: hypothetical protein KC983_04085, partial [Phycisphaerales bacterium]|nr:hypothetical protein [Phycisphaerales bacterium]